MPAIKYLNTRLSANSFRIILETVRPADIDALMDAITARYRQYPGMRAFASRGSIISSNDGGTRSVNLDVSGPGLDVIYTAGDGNLSPRRGGPRQSPYPVQPVIACPVAAVTRIRPDPGHAPPNSAWPPMMSVTVAALTDGAFVDEYFEGDDKIDMYLYGTTGGETDLDSLGGLPIFTPQGSILPLDAIATIRETVDTNSIRRINAQRTVTLNIIPPASIALEEGVEIVRNDVVAYLRGTGALPANVNVDISGASDQLDATKAALRANLPVSLVIIYLLLVAIFRHWGYPWLDHDNDSALYRRRHCRAGAAERRWRRCSAGLAWGACSSRST